MATEHLGATPSVNNDLVRKVDLTAANVVNTPAGTIAATTVQAALNELDTEKVMVPVRDSDTTARSTTSTTYVDASSTASFTMTYPSTGRLLVALYGVVWNSGANSTFLSFEIRDTNSGGTLRRASTDLSAILTQTTTLLGAGSTVAVTGLPTSGTMFIRPMLRAAAGTANMTNVELTVIPLI